MAKESKTNQLVPKNPTKVNTMDGTGTNIFSDKFYQQALTPKPPAKPVQKSAPAPKKKP